MEFLGSKVELRQGVFEDWTLNRYGIMILINEDKI